MNLVRILAIALLLLFFGAASGSANTIALEGSDATAFHRDGNYTHQLFTYLQGESSLPVLVLGGISLSSSLPAGQYTLAPDYTLSGYNLADYSALYIESLGGCCSQADKAISATDQAAIGKAEAAGLNLGIENYGGGPAWGAILPGAVNALPSSDFAGINGFGTGSGSTCTDGEKFTPYALSLGFTQPPELGCYSHQQYLDAPFAALGFNSLVTADPSSFGGAPASSFEGIGGVFTEPPAPGVTPEPSSLLLLGTGLMGAVGIARRRLRGSAAL